MEVYCPKCESANPEDVVMCLSCGHHLQRESSPDKESPRESKTDVLIAATGHNGQLEMTDSVVRIKRKGIWALLTQGLKGDKEILISHISSIQLKKADSLLSLTFSSSGFLQKMGYIQFSFLGGLEAKDGFFGGRRDENTVMFKAEQQQSFEDFRDYLQKRMQSNTKLSSSVEELERLASLRDKGVVTPEEFQAKKKQILGL